MSGTDAMGVLSAPRLETERLILRAPRRADFEVCGSVLMSQRAQYIGGPMTLAGAWREFAGDAGAWALLGYGAFAIEPKDPADFGGARCLGLIFLNHPAHFPEREIGWMIAEPAEGRGVAREAALAVRLWAARTLGGPALVSYIDARNDRSIALAERLGAVRDPAARAPDFDSGGETLVYRHPAPQTLIEEAAA